MCNGLKLWTGGAIGCLSELYAEIGPTRWVILIETETPFVFVQTDATIW